MEVTEGGLTFTLETVKMPEYVVYIWRQRQEVIIRAAAGGRDVSVEHLEIANIDKL